MQRILILFIAALAAAGLPSSGAAGRGIPARKVSERLCAPAVLAVRGGTDACWGRFDLSPRRRLCIRRELWVRLLRGGAPCGMWGGRWRTFESPLAGTRRPTVAAFYADSLPAPEGQWRLRPIEQVRERAAALFEPEDRMGILRKLLVNQGAPGGALDLLRILGFVHLVTAAGIHLYALARLSEGISRGVLLRAGIGVERALWLSRLTSFVLWSSVWILEGMRAGMLRPFVIVCLRNAAGALGFGWRRYFPLVFSLAMDGAIALFFLFAEPDRVWAPGRIHYALAVGGGLMALDALRDRGTFREHAALSIGSWLPTALWDAATTGLVAAATPVLSLLTIPAFTLAVLPAALSIVVVDRIDPSLAAAGAGALAWVSESAIRGCALASMSARTLLVVSPEALAIGPVLGGLVLWMRPRARPWIALPVIVCAALRAGSPPPPAEPLAREVRQLDVGQGDAALVVFGSGRAMLIDTGSARAKRPADWIGAIAASRVSRLERIVLTHLDEDHAGALGLISEILPVGEVLVSDSQLHSPGGRDLARQLPGLSYVGSPRGVLPFEFRVLQEIHHGAEGNRRMSGVLVRLKGGGFYLNLGDAEREVESRLAGRWRLPRGRPRILKLSHHGSRSSSDPAFIQWVDPDQAWVSAGAGNPHGHPTAEVVERVDRLGIPLFRTDREGDLVWSHGKRALIPNVYR